VPGSLAFLCGHKRSEGGTFQVNSSQPRHSNPSCCGPVIEEFDDQPMTKRGGYGLLRRFLQKLGLPGQLQGLPKACPDGQRYQSHHYLAALLCGSLVGCHRQAHIAALAQDPILGDLLETSFPSQSRLSYFLNQCSAGVAESLLELNRAWLRRLRRTQVVATLDLDTTVISTCGSPQGADYGYNPKRQGAQSYVAMLVFCGQSREALHGSLHSGKCATISAQRAIASFEAGAAALGPQVQRVHARADAGYYSEAFLAYLEARRVTYYVAARGSEGLRSKLPGLSYRELDEKWAVAELYYQPPSASRPRRYVVVREKLEPDHRGSKQLLLLSHQGYGFQVIVTSNRHQPEQVWHEYNRRCRAENSIKEQQSDFGLDHVLCRSGGGNATWLALALLAYNLMNWFREVLLGQKGHRHTAAWLRERLFELPGRLVRGGRRRRLKLLADTLGQRLFAQALFNLQVFRL